MLSWQLPDIANNSDVALDSYSISYGRIGSGAYMTRNSQIPRIAIGGLESGPTYMFNVSANYSRPVLQSTEQTLRRMTQRELKLYSGCTQRGVAS